MGSLFALAVSFQIPKVVLGIMSDTLQKHVEWIHPYRTEFSGKVGYFISTEGLGVKLHFFNLLLPEK